jgi:hypothetical protein
MSQPRATTLDPSGEETQLLFRWRGLPDSPFPKFFIVVLTTFGFALLLMFARVKVAAPQFNMASKASWIQVPATGSGAFWTLRAKEGGPSLARYEPADWYAYATLEQELSRATRIPAFRHVPQLRVFPQESPVEALEPASEGEAVFPHRAGAAAERREMAEYRLAPVLYPLSTIGESGLPQSLPPFVGEVDMAMAAVEWRFLLRLHPAGGVADCVSLSNAAGAIPLEKWLRGVTFDPKLGADGGWLAVGIEFNNQPDHGPDAR